MLYDGRLLLIPGAFWLLYLFSRSEVSIIAAGDGRERRGGLLLLLDGWCKKQSWEILGRNPS